MLKITFLIIFPHKNWSLLGTNVDFRLDTQLRSLREQRVNGRFGRQQSLGGRRYHAGPSIHQCYQEVDVFR
jgi:hypothetical protein